MPASELERLFRWDAWANREAAASLRGPDAPCEGVRALAHLAGAGWLWHARLHGLAPRLAVWPELGVDGATRELEELAAAWSAFLAGLDGSGLERVFDYVNSKGESWTSRVDDVLMHVVLHGAHHRGQIASAVRAAGGEPAYADFIQAVRTGCV